MSPRLALAAVALLAGCGPETTRLSGVETRGLTDSPRTVPAAATPVAGGTQLELVTADGVVYAGLLTLVQQPVVVPISATGQPLIGGEIEYMGDVSNNYVRDASTNDPGNASYNTLVMNCRFRLLNPPRGLDGGGTGRCAGSGRRVDFQF